MDTNGLLLSVLTFVLHFQAVISITHTSLFFSGGQDAILPCANASPTDTACSYVSWFYRPDQQYFTVVENGNVKMSRLASRLSLDTRCSLVIKNITGEDVGLFGCRQGIDVNQDETMFLNVLTISPSPPDADPKRDGEVTLACSLWRFNGFTCPQHSIRWADETGAELLDEGVGHRVHRQTNCVSSLTVKRQSGLSRRYTCRFVEENRVVVEAEYTPDFTGGPTSGPDPTGWTPLSYTMLCNGGLILIVVITVVVITVVVITVVVIRKRWNSKPLDEDYDDVDHEVQYANVEAASAAARL